MFVWRTLSALQEENILLRENLVAAMKDKSHLEQENRRLEIENSLLSARVSVLEADEREIRLNLLRRSGILPSEGEVDKKDREFKPVKKTILPWSQAAAKLEADSKERYWKKQIELSEQTQDQRKKQSPEAQEDIDKDLAVLNNVSSS